MHGDIFAEFDEASTGLQAFLVIVRVHSACELWTEKLLDLSVDLVFLRDGMLVTVPVSDSLLLSLQPVFSEDVERGETFALVDLYGESEAVGLLFVEICWRLEM